ncbi:MAG TPA: hypothetical protein DCY55_13395 [Gammaproteobacteria bacterium]|jgi:hypothetical protein|nr:hypothetical protein [Pseudomonadota bacterium]HAY47258.1 hypothetical protein [Gammaproteobacteria bacterium]
MNEIIITAIGLGVTASLIFVGMQIRRNSDASVSDSNVMRELRSLYTQIAQDEGLADLFRSGMHDIDAISVADKFRFTLIAHNFFRLFEEAYYLNVAGKLAAKDWHGLTEQFLFLKDLPGFQTFWRDRKFLFSDKFCVYYEEEIIPAHAHTKFEYR